MDSGYRLHMWARVYSLIIFRLGFGRDVNGAGISSYGQRALALTRQHKGRAICGYLVIILY
jgi:hypothetical protein